MEQIKMHIIIIFYSCLKNMHPVESNVREGNTRLVKPQGGSLWMKKVLNVPAFSDNANL